MRSRQTPNKATFLTLLASFACLPVLLVFVGLSLGGDHRAVGVTGSLVVAGLSLFAAGLWLTWARLSIRWEVDGLVVLPTPSRFQADMLILLACFEMPAVLGFTLALVGDSSFLLPGAGLAIAGDLLVVLPLVLRYWALRDRLP